MKYIEFASALKLFIKRDSKILFQGLILDSSNILHSMFQTQVRQLNVYVQYSQNIIQPPFKVAERFKGQPLHELNKKPWPNAIARGWLHMPDSDKN